MIKRVRLLENFIVEPVRASNDVCPNIRLPKGLILNCIPDKYGCVQIILPKNFHKKVGVSDDVYGYKHDYTDEKKIKVDEEIIGRKLTKFIRSLNIEYLYSKDEGKTFEFVK